ncbi:hypothetical protein GMORB2_1704 [Geosmithia morbida]|uniref:Uncharacterized protein n=1 Tax=Geosmithia morbida TaxID=1094350 RepID=A0A9P5D4V1_9HYPO|nr:uncharacterized protein GMORB2_1704 [Geosmithia morbida]KAF4121864.1 hypothetical protein GMORB2_1704 [Geosmithia morbida]
MRPSQGGQSGTTTQPFGQASSYAAGRSRVASPVDTGGWGRAGAALDAGQLGEDWTRRLPRPSDREYCTQACLRGLCDGSDMDPLCPNWGAHRRPPDGSGPERTRHPLSRAALAGEAVRQLEAVTSPYVSERSRAAKVGPWQHLGARSVVTKLELDGYGYTMVAKVVYEEKAGVLEREEAVYAGLGLVGRTRGVVVPVSLGCATLTRRFPLDPYRQRQPVRGPALRHMMLMSYAGPPLAGDPVSLPDPAEVDVEVERQRTMAELDALGLVKHGERSLSTFTWCQESRRVMELDFEMAYLIPHRM